MLRRARADDVEAIATIFEGARAEAMPWLPVMHSAEEDRFFFARCAAGQEVWVAEADGCIAGFAALHDAFLNHLYVAPESQRRGVGDALFAQAKQSSPAGFRFWVFQENHRARRFYEARGARVVKLTDGAENEEKLPDALYEWLPAP